MLRRYVQFTVLATFILLIAGGLVTSTDSGLAVPDWPLAYGMWFPPMVGGILYEHGHRMIAGVVGLMIFGLAGWLWKREPRRWVRVLGVSAAGAVMLQALLGGLTVLLLLPPSVSIAHACLGQGIFVLVACVAAATSSSWEARPTPIAVRALPSLPLLGLVTVLLAAIQLLLGAVIRHTGYAVSAHVGVAAGLGVVVAWLLVQLWRVRAILPRCWRSACRLAGLLGTQAVLGLSVFAHRPAVGWRTSHQAVGALVLAQAVLTAWQVRRDTLTSTGGQRLGLYLELTKPRLAALVLMTTGIGYWLASPGPVLVPALIHTLVGTALVVGGANALNQWMERDTDALMQRTKARPLPSGRLAPEPARRFGLGLLLVGTLWLGWRVNLLSAALAALAAISYLGGYTPLKRKTSLCTLVGAIPGALPPMIGWAAARHHLDLGAWGLFALLFMWQLPHFLAIAQLYREDYARAGSRMLPVLDHDGRVTARQMALYGMALVPVSLFPALIGVSGARYGYGALLCSLLFLLCIVRSALGRSPRRARQVFTASITYLPLVMLLLGWDKSAIPIQAAWAATYQVPAFSLTDQQGRAVTRAALNGKVWIADFIFTRCAGQCPMMQEQMAVLQRVFESTPTVHLVSFSVDPAHDTPRVLAAHAQRYGAQASRWHWLTGPAAAVTQLAQDGFRLNVAEGGSAQEPITHSVRLVLVDQQGRIRGYYDTTDAEAMARLQREARQLVSEVPRS